MREHQCLAATGNVEYGFSRVKGVSNMLLGGTGFFIDHFTAQNGEGIVWVHGYGNVFEVTLAAGEQIDIEPGGWIYKERSVQMQTTVQKLTTGLFASAGQIVFNRFTGPGKVALQSMYYHMEGGESPSWQPRDSLGGSERAFSRGRPPFILEVPRAVELLGRERPCAGQHVGHNLQGQGLLVDPVRPLGVADLDPSVVGEEHPADRQELAVILGHLARHRDNAPPTRHRQPRGPGTAESPSRRR